jgi:hypothetical protein
MSIDNSSLLCVMQRVLLSIMDYSSTRTVDTCYQTVITRTTTTIIQYNPVVLLLEDSRLVQSILGLIIEK